MREITLTKNKIALVDDEDWLWLNAWKWKLSTQGYAVRNGSGAHTQRKAVSMHRQVVHCPAHLWIDHINGNRLDNRKINLRVCNQAENTYNQLRLYSNKHGFPGVQWHKGKKRWRAKITIQNICIYLGEFKELEQAAKAYEAAVLKYHGEYAAILPIPAERLIASLRRQINILQKELEALKNK